ncbi:MAG: hypothetical protein DHS20C01_25480 [marine bacterium B5-7]|nr:MAG: hypothetical protein DHS20C01_25480 [marine bacterium B5-7]
MVGGGAEPERAPGSDLESDPGDTLSGVLMITDVADLPGDGGTVWTRIPGEDNTGLLLVVCARAGSFDHGPSTMLKITKVGTDTGRFTMDAFN